MCSFFKNFGHSYFSVVYYFKRRYDLNFLKHNDFDFVIFGYYYNPGHNILVGYCVSVKI